MKNSNRPGLGNVQALLDLTIFSETFWLASRPRHAQRGYTSLMVILVLLIALTTVTLTATRSGMLEHGITGNDIRTGEVQQAAEAGLEYSIAWTAQNTIPWDNPGDSQIDCVLDAGCPALPSTLAGNDGGAINVTLRFERDPASPNYIKITAVATQAENNSRAAVSRFISQDGVPIPGTWRDF